MWARLAAVQEERPGGFVVAALMRPADAEFGEDESVFVERAREASVRGPFGHHTHWTAPDHARPTSDGTGERVLAEGVWLREHGLAPTLFCGGGWYTDVDVAEACAELGYTDCTPRSTRPPYLTDDAKWASATEPTTVDLPSGRPLRVIPTTHSLGDLARALTRPRLPRLLHVYFHDTDLLDRRRRAILGTALPVLARRARATDLDWLATQSFQSAGRVRWDDVARL